MARPSTRYETALERVPARRTRYGCTWSGGHHRCSWGGAAAESRPRAGARLKSRRARPRAPCCPPEPGADLCVRRAWNTLYAVSTLVLGRGDSRVRQLFRRGQGVRGRSRTLPSRARIRRHDGAYASASKGSALLARGSRHRSWRGRWNAGARCELAALRVRIAVFRRGSCLATQEALSRSRAASCSRRDALRGWRASGNDPGYTGTPRPGRRAAREPARLPRGCRQHDTLPASSAQ